jgi:folylpolyglutamate synthase/dihydropteroate synthase
MRDKDVDEMLRILLPHISHIVFTRVSSSRSADPSDLDRRARAIAPHVPSLVESSPAAALAAAWCFSPQIVVAGSILFLGDVMKEIG